MLKCQNCRSLYSSSFDQCPACGHGKIEFRDKSTRKHIFEWASQNLKRAGVASLYQALRQNYGLTKEQADDVMDYVLRERAVRIQGWGGCLLALGSVGMAVAVVASVIVWAGASLDPGFDYSFAIFRFVVTVASMLILGAALILLRWSHYDT